MMSASPWVAQYLTSHPILLDELLDTRTLYAAPDWREAARQLRAQMDDAAGDTEKQMDVLRHFKHAHTMRLIAQDLSGAAAAGDAERPPERPRLRGTGGGLARHLAAAAGAPRQRRASPSSPTASSAARNSATPPISTWCFSTTTPHRRPPKTMRASRSASTTGSPASRPPACSTKPTCGCAPTAPAGCWSAPLASFRDYQNRHAWLWEHQALTRARFVAGDPDIGTGFERFRVEVLRQERDPGTLQREVAAMRQKMLDAHPNRTQRFDLKHDRGGIIDVEFAVQYLVLGHAHRHEELTGNIGNLALLKLAARLGLVGAAPRAGGARRLPAVPAAAAQPAPAGRAIRPHRARCRRERTRGGAGVMARRDG